MFIHYCCYLCFARDMGSRIYIGRLPYRAQERDIEKFFKGYGKVRDIMLKNGYGFVVRMLFPFCLLSFEHIRFKLALLLYNACTNHLPSYILIFYGHTLQLCWRLFLCPLSIRCKVCCPWHASCLWRVVPPSGIPYHLMSEILLPRLSFTLNSKFTFSVLPMYTINYLASICTSELCKEIFIKFPVCCIVSIHSPWFSSFSIHS